MRALFAMGIAKGKRSEEILDLTAPEKDDGIVARWLRESLAFTSPEPAYVLRRRMQESAV